MEPLGKGAKKKKAKTSVNLELMDFEVPMEGEVTLDIPNYSQMVGASFNSETQKLMVHSVSGEYPKVKIKFLTMKSGSQVEVRKGGEQMVHLATCNTPQGVRHIFQWVRYSAQ